LSWPDTPDGTHVTPFGLSRKRQRQAEAAVPHSYPFAQPTPVDPAPLLAELRQREPVSRIVMPWGDPAYLVTRYHDARQVLLDPVFSLGQVWNPGTAQFVEVPQQPVAASVPNLDPPGHTVLRRLVAPVFTPRRMERARAMVEAVAARLIDEARPPADLGRALCDPLPLEVICRLLGLPRQDWESAREWSGAIAMGGSDEQWQQAWTGLGAYLSALIADKRETPADDVLSELAAVFAGQSELPQFHLVTLGVQLLVDGHQTTSSQLRMVLFALLRDTATYQALVARPELVAATVEELLRLHPHDEPIFRVATTDTTISGTTIPTGSLVLIEQAAVNRDPAAFTDADTMTLSRDDNNHLTFGHGPHRCLGAALARIQIQTVVSELVRRFPGLRLADGQSGVENVTW
jgi:cytochrome P450